MKLVIKRTKKTTAIGGKSKYQLYVRADITDEEKALIKENSLGKTQVVYHDRSGGIGAVAQFSFWASLWKMIKDTQMTVDTFVRGTTFGCKDVTELIDIEYQVRGASLTLRTILEMAKTFGGEEVLDVDQAFEDAYRAKKSRA
jgi:hypothetical protein